MYASPVPLVLRETELWKISVKRHHHLVSMNLGNDRCQRYREAYPVTFDDRLPVAIDAMNAERIHQREVNHLELPDCLAQCPLVRNADTDVVNLGWVNLGNGATDIQAVEDIDNASPGIVREELAVSWLETRPIQAASQQRAS